jgi:hypothetical protein
MNPLPLVLFAITDKTFVAAVVVIVAAVVAAVVVFGDGWQ